ncbi:hypothetical protein L195_g026121 [Trifolium pratense]|uniref:Uncharacterized protein n=1 Tax=Trifolium pratense TaxID=57577 RepID=A0A2K3NIE7_TRIPR|nr:hypothetical protein L195_g026121 [Trifolium pratense]
MTVRIICRELKGVMDVEGQGGMQKKLEAFAGDPNANMWAHMMHQHQQLQAQQAQQYQEMMMMMFQQHMNNPQNQTVGGSAAFKEFCRMNPPEFVGEYVPASTREWIH